MHTFGFIVGSCINTGAYGDRKDTAPPRLEQLSSLLTAGAITRFRQSYRNVYGKDGFRGQPM